MSSDTEKEGNYDNDVFEKITKPALQRLLRRAGVKRISDPVFDLLREIIKNILIEIVKNTLIFVQAAKRKTVQVEDLTAALHIMNIHLAAGLNINSKNPGKSLQSCNSVGKSGPVKKNKEESKKPSRKLKSSTRALKTINYHQINSDCLAIPKENFKRLIKYISSLYIDDIRFSEGIIDLFQLVVEDHVINISKKAYRCTIFDKRDTIHSKDIELVIDILEL
jgi:histone H3/H4